MYKLYSKLIFLKVDLKYPYVNLKCYTSRVKFQNHIWILKIVIKTKLGYGIA